MDPRPRPPRAGAAGVDRAGRWTLTGMVLAAVAVSAAMTERSLADRELLAFLALGAGVLVLLLGWGDRLAAHPSRAARGLYFAAGFALVATLLVLLARMGSYGIAWLLFMPLVAQAVLHLPWRLALPYALAVPLATGVHAARLGGLRPALESAAGVATGVAFVVLFTSYVRREARARAESERLGGELVAANERLAALAAAAEELATTRERNRLAREIHDSLGHYLTVMGVQLEVAERALAAAPEAGAEALARVRCARALARDGLADVRRSVGALRAAPLGERSLAAAVAELVAAAQGAAGAVIAQRVEGTPRPLPPDVALTLYRAAQEGLTNARKHARAAQVEVVLDYRREDWVRVEVSDDGVGANPPRAGFGIAGLEERARGLGGRLAVGSAAGRGFSLTVEVPT